MNTGLGEALTITRKAREITQAQLAERVGVSQAAVNRYEAGLRDPDETTLKRLSEELRVTPEFLRHGNRFVGALAVDAHMRRQKTTRASVWRRLEASLNLLRLQSSLLYDEVSLSAQYIVPAFDPIETSPEAAARMVRAQWRLPIGPVSNLTRRIEAAGCLVFEDDFGTTRVDGLSQWVDDHPIMLINRSLPTDRKRLTLAHELGHLCLHSSNPTEDMESEANRFAQEFLMPEAVIRNELRRLDFGALHDLKREWGVSMQAIIERAYGLGFIKPVERASFYRSLNARGWKTQEPLSDALAHEEPGLAIAIAETMRGRGLSDVEIALLAGAVDPADTPFRAVPTRRLKSV